MFVFSTLALVRWLLAYAALALARVMPTIVAAHTIIVLLFALPAASVQRPAREWFNQIYHLVRRSLL